MLGGGESTNWESNYDLFLSWLSSTLFSDCKFHSGGAPPSAAPPVAATFGLMLQAIPPLVHSYPGDDFSDLSNNFSSGAKNVLGVFSPGRPPVQSTEDPLLNGCEFTPKKTKC